MGSDVYGFDAIRGIQAGREFYVAMCPLKIIPKIFVFNDFDIPPELRAQRTLRETRIPAIKNYILNNPNDYTFSSLTASVDGKMKFTPAASLDKDGKLGRLYINMDSRFLINDGQHRRKAIEEALKEKPELGHEMISVVFFRDDGLKRSQQMFSDLNKNAVKPTKSLNILYDHRNDFSKFIVNLVNTIDIFKGRVELEKTTISNRSTKTFTLNGISDASMKLLGSSKGNKISKKEEEFLQEFWEIVSKNMPEWQLLLENDVAPAVLRKDFVSTNTNLLNALGIAGKIIIDEFPKTWKDKLKNLKKIDWSRNNPEWDGRLLRNGQMTKLAIGIDLAANVIIQKCGGTLSESRQKIEAKL
ncbi:DNA sulfur modification protein DndB [Candidatus Nitrosopumilus salaria BD31]|uniref:DNA sulfur modification protein DndB n=1 Tax=Candidatus Nitrosopumilus salarius BD31 TaxID=859350 RepID=I3CZX2_9ARCH|nr:DNA sulfur modification protein DndB [Candidatus Nitrosopumilus salaria BD31]